MSPLARADAPRPRSCNDCFDDHAALFNAGDLKLIQARKGLLYCPLRSEDGKGCAAPAFVMEELRNRSAKTLELYIKTREKLTVKQTMDEAQREAARLLEADAGLSADERAVKHGVEAVQKLLNDACPVCKQVRGCPIFSSVALCLFRRASDAGALLRLRRRLHSLTAATR